MYTRSALLIYPITLSVLVVEGQCLITFGSSFINKGRRDNKNLHFPNDSRWFLSMKVLYVIKRKVRPYIQGPYFIRAIKFVTSCRIPWQLELS